MRTRAERRHHHQRMIKKAKKSFMCTALKEFVTEEEWYEKVAKLSETRAPCSCHMCGNPRKHYKEITIQERRFFSDSDGRDDDC